MKKLIFLLVITVIHLTTVAQELSSAKHQEYIKKFEADANIIPAANFAFGKAEVKLVGKDSENGLALFQCGNDVVLYQVKTDRFIAFWTSGPKSDGFTKLNKSGGTFRMAPGGKRIAQVTDEGSDIYSAEGLITFIPGVFVQEFINNEEVVASSKSEKKRFTWNIASAKMNAKLPGDGDVSISPGGTKLLIWEGIKKVNVYDIASGKTILKLPFGSAVWLTDQYLLYNGLQVTDMQTMQEVKLANLEGNTYGHLTGGGIMAQRNFHNLVRFYDIKNQRYLNTEATYIPSGANEFMVVADPPSLLGVSRYTGAYGVYAYVGRGVSSAVLATAAGETKPLNWHAATKEGRDAVAQATKDYWVKTGIELKEKREKRMKLALAKYGTQACADKFFHLIEQEIDSGTTVSYKGQKYIFRRAECRSEEIYLYKPGNNMYWGLASEVIKGAYYVPDIKKSYDKLNVCVKCNGQGAIVYEGTVVYKKDLPQGYFSGIETKRIYERKEFTRVKCEHCKGIGVR